MVPELRNLDYADRLRAMKLPSMYYRRARGDMIEVYNYLHGQYNVDEVPLLLDEIRVTRGHSRRLEKRKSGDETKEKSFPAQNRQQVELPHRGSSHCAFTKLV